MIKVPARPGLAEFSTGVIARIDQLAAGLPQPLRAPVRDLAGRPGKLLRPALLHACSGFGTPDPDRVVRLGALVELLHLASMLHDDVIDRARVRRGGPAAYTVVGCELAMLAGLACFALAGTEAADLGQGVGRLFGRAVAGLSYGEMLDVERAFDTALTLPDYLELIERKTGDLFRLSCLLGAVEARVGRESAEALGAFGRDFGVAFQILDDCLDLAAGPAAGSEADGTGKPGGTDHLLGLFGAPTLCALAEDTSGELATLLLSPAFTTRDMAAVRALVVATGGLDAANRLARERYDHALSRLAGLSDDPARAALAGVAHSAWRDQT